MIGNILQAELEELIRDKKWDELREALTVLEAPDIAEVIMDLPPEDEGIIFRVLPRDSAAATFSYLPVEQQEQLIRSVSSETSRTILDGMTPDDRARLLEEMPAEVTRRILESLSPEELKATRRILNYPEHSAGRYLTPEYVAIRPDMTAREALEHVRRTGRGKETLSVLYVVEGGKLVAEVRLGTVVMANPDTQIRDINDRPLVSVQATADRESMVELFEKYDRTALPVTDTQGNMLGIITADDVLDIAEMEATEDMQKMGGTEALEAPYLSVGFWDMVKKRGFWLTILFLAQMLTASAMGFFEDEIHRAAVVALFIPLIISSGGNCGSQGTSLIIRSMALRQVKLEDWWRVFGRELRVGLALGLMLGVLGFLRIAAWQGMSHVPLVGHLFQSETGTAHHVIPTEMKIADEDVDLKEPLEIAPGFVLPAGATLTKGSYVPHDTAITITESNGKSRAVRFITHDQRTANTAYGEYWMLIGFTLLFSVIGVVVWGNLAGSLLPFALQYFGLDPAASSAPFVATLVDVTGVLIYFGVAKIFLTGTLL